MPKSIIEHLVVPIANEEDAHTTANILKSYEFNHITAVHVIEKGGGAPDKISLKQAEKKATKAFNTFFDIIPKSEKKLTYNRDVVDAVINVTENVGGSAIAFRPRGGSRIIQFLSGDKALRLITESDKPVIALPEKIKNEDE